MSPADADSDPVRVLVGRESLRAVTDAMKNLPTLERSSLLLLVNGGHPHSGGVDKRIDGCRVACAQKLKDVA